jgi:outer membrane murein-binding lipoprotein Lpp
MLVRVAVFASVLGLVACQTSPQMEELRSRNQKLEQQLSQARSEVDALAAENQSRQQTIQELKRIMAILEAEKTSRSAESTELRRQVRGFVQGQIDALRSFLVRGELLDYIGDELVVRNQIKSDPLLLVDLANPVPRNGSLTGVAAHFSQPASFRVKIFRPVEDELVVIWESALIDVQEAGPFRYQFPVSVGIERGDYLGYHFPQNTAVAFDAGTGNTRYSKRDVKLGQTIAINSLNGADEQRAYSIGVYGLLNLSEQ